MSDVLRKPFSVYWSLILAIPVIISAVTVNLPEKWGAFIGDSAVYYAMADSMAHDLDLQYTKSDLVRITREWPSGPQGVLLVADETDPSIIHYAKPILYPLLSAPFVSWLNSNGLLLMNALCFLVIISTSLFALDGNKDFRIKAALWTFSFWGLTVIPAYIYILTPDLFNCAFIMAGLLPWLYWEHSKNESKSNILLMLSAMMIGIATAARPPNGLFLVLPVWSLLSQSLDGVSIREWSAIRKRIIILILMVAFFVAGAILILKLTEQFTGQMISHGGFRKRIVGHLPFELPGFNFINTGNEISTRNIKFVFHFKTLWLNLKYFFFGRFTGMVLYFFPAFISLLLALPWMWTDKSVRKSDSPVRYSALVVCAGMVLFHLIFIPTNYHGGSCSIGNRYLVSFLPAFFLILRRPPSLKIILVTIFITAILTGPVALNPIDSMARYQDVSKRSTFDRFPLEITLLNSWPNDSQRSVRVPFDGYFAYFADDDQWGKELNGFWTAGDAATSLVIRCWKPADRLKLEIGNGGASNHLEIKAGRATFCKHALPGEQIEWICSPGPPTYFYNLAGNPSYCYQIDIRNSDGFIPMFSDPNSTDPRFLGSFIKIITEDNFSGSKDK